MPEKDAPDSSDSLAPGGPRRFFLDPRAAGGRLLIAIVMGILAMFLTPSSLPLEIRGMVGWDASALMYIVLAWVGIVPATPERTEQRAAMEDAGRHAVFIIASVASFVSLFAAVHAFRRIRHLDETQAGIWTALALSAIVLSWFVTHTTFTLRYAHLYYRRRGKTGCLKFEGTEDPCELDFAYFAFTIGMCFQTSDVVIASSSVRRAVLVHSLMSFAYNTTLLALALNLVTTLLS